MIDGVETDHVPVADSSVLRGDGCFEAIRSYRGRVFRLSDHLDRLDRSAAGLGLSVPPRGELEAWVERVAGPRDCIVRIILSRGDAVGDTDGVSRCLVLSHPVGEAKSSLRLWPVPAPWHPAGRPWELAGVKTISYAPNLAATRVAQTHGADDALLVSDGGMVLEGPTFSVGWFRDGALHTPPLDLGILDSITRRLVLGMVPDFKEVTAPVDELLAADEVFAVSTVKEVTAVTALGGHELAPGPLTEELAQRFQALAGHTSTADQPR